MICTPCLSDLHEFCRDDVRDCGCDCTTWYGFASLDDIERTPWSGSSDVEPDDDADDDAWQVEQDRYERRVSGD